MTSGSDRIDVTDLAAGDAISFLGNQADFTSAQAALSAGSGELELVYQADARILWADVNDDGLLDDNDLQVELSGTASLSAGDIFAQAAAPTIEPWAPPVTPMPEHLHDMGPIMIARG